MVKWENLPLFIGLLGPLLLGALVFVYSLGLITALLDAVGGYFIGFIIGLTVLGFAFGIWTLFKRRFKLLVILGVVLTGGELLFYGYLILYFNSFITY